MRRRPCRGPRQPPVGAALVAVALLIASNKAAAQTRVLRQVPDARSYALAAAGVADASDPGTIWHNPANAALLHGIYGVVSAGNITSDWPDRKLVAGQVSGAGHVYRRNSLTVGLGGELRYEDHAGGGDYASAAIAADLMVWRGLHIACGGRYKAANSDPLWFYAYGGESFTLYDLGGRVGFAGTAESGWLFDAALAYSAQNEGSPPAYSAYFVTVMHTVGISAGVSSPTRAKFGAEVPDFSLRLNIDYANWQRRSSDGDVVRAVGVETAFSQIGFVRAGWSEGEFVAGLGLGAKIRRVRFRTDLAFGQLYSRNDAAYLSLLAGWEW